MNHHQRYLAVLEGLGASALMMLMAWISFHNGHVDAGLWFSVVAALFLFSICIIIITP